jgi:hypothetical protein
MTGSMYIGDSIGNGIELKGDSGSFIRSSNYAGFDNTISGSTPSGFLLYSGSIQNQISSSESYNGVGFEYVSNNGFYIRANDISDIEMKVKEIQTDTISADNIITPDGIEKVYEITLDKTDINDLNTTPIIIPVADLGVDKPAGERYKIIGADIEFDNDGIPFAYPAADAPPPQFIRVYDATNIGLGLTSLNIDKIFVEITDPFWVITTKTIFSTYIITDDDLKIDATDTIAGGDTNASIKFRIHYKVYKP